LGLRLSQPAGLTQKALLASLKPMGVVMLRHFNQSHPRSVCLPHPQNETFDAGWGYRMKFRIRAFALDAEKGRI
jgi:hypothetical protein